MNTPLILNAAATWALVGLVWTVQVVHYPLFDGVGIEAFPAWHRRHATRITFLVGLWMPLEALTAIWLVLAPPPGVAREVLAAGLGLVVLVWAATAFLAVPCHRRLGEGFDLRTVRRLVATNWVRTLAWTARGLLMGWVLLTRLGTP